MAVKFRPALGSERAEVEAVVKACGKYVRTYSGIMSLDRLWANGSVHVGLDHDQPGSPIVAFAVAPHLVRKPWTSVYEIGVHPDHQRRGIGAEFIRYLLRASPHRQLRLVCDVTNTGGLAFYESLGFVKLAKDPRTNRTGEGIVDLALRSL